MIDRYSRKILKNLWSETEKYSSWAKVERAHLEVLVEREIAPKSVLKDFDNALSKKTAEEYLQREQETGHDVIAFIAELGDAMGDTGAFVHKGLTSSDVVDTALVLRIRESIQIVLKSLKEVRVALTEKSFEFHDTLCIGRTHGIHAEPLSFGQVLANHFAEFNRAHTELLEAEKHISFGKLSGAVGNYTQLDAQFEFRVLSKLNLRVEPVSSQIIPRDKILCVAKALLSCANAVDRFAMNLRHWARTELREVLEPFGKKQKGSSAMPHKKNPILSENLCGLARTVRGYFTMLMENGALWHERDISHSSVERIALPDIFATTDFMLVRLASVIQNMNVNKEAILAQVWKTGGLWASQNVLTALVSKGLNRVKAYECVQTIALQLHELDPAMGKPRHDSKKSQDECAFQKSLEKDPIIKKYLNKSELKNLFSTEKYLNSAPLVFKRVFGVEPMHYKDVKKVPSLQTVIKVTVELFPDVLDAESKTIQNDMKRNHISTIDVRTQKCFLIKLEDDKNISQVENYANKVLYNSVMEQIFIERVN